MCGDHTRDRGQFGDLFNVANANTPPVRVRNIPAANFGLFAQNLSPRILRIGVKVEFQEVLGGRGWCLVLSAGCLC